MVVLNIETSGCQPQTIVIGRRGTYETTQIAFGLTYLVEAYGSGVAVLAVKRSQDESAYPAVVTQENNTLTWTVSETDTAYVGAGECQLMWYVEGGLAKTIIYPMVVMRDILQTAEEPPDGYENWVEHLTGLGAETQQNAQNAAQSATEAKASAEAAAESEKKAEDAADFLENVSATATTLEPGQPATAEYDEGVFKFGIPKGDKLTYADLTEADKEDLVQGPIKDAQDDAVEAVDTAKTNAVNAVNGAGTTQVQNVNSAGSTQVNTVNQAGTTQVGNVNQAGATQVQAIEDKGDEVIDSIPSDYSDLTAEVDNLTRQLSDETTGLDTKAPVIINTASGAIASFSDGADSMPIRKLVAQIEPVQDLHGYANPWPAGGGKNKLPNIFTGKTESGITFTVNSDGTVVATGTATGRVSLSAIVNADENLVDGTSYILSGCPAGGSNTTFQAAIFTTPSYSTQAKDLGNGVTFKYVKTSGDSFIVALYVESGYACPPGGLVFKPMIRLATEADSTFAPYENICPISGWTGAEIEQTGKNLLRLVESEMTNVGWNREFPFSIKAGTYTLSCQNKFVVDSLDGCQINLRDDDNNDIVTITTGYNFGSVEFRKTSVITEEMANAITKILFQPRAGGCTFANIMDAEIMLELRSSATDYEPYTGNQISVNWETEAGTVYGGTDEIVSGALASKMGYVDLGTLTWAYNGTVKFFQADLSNIAPVVYSAVPNAICSMYAAGSVAAVRDGTTIGFALNQNGYVYVRDLAYTDAATFKSAMSGVQLCYELATPIEYTITPTELTTLYGQNNVWTDVGEVSVTYPADTKLYIDKKITTAIANALNA